MLTKEKIISAIQAMPEDNFKDIEFVLDTLIELAEVEKEKNYELQEPMIAYGTSNLAKENGLDAFSQENHAEMMVSIDKKLSEATDPETIYLINKIKHSLENIQAGNFYTIEQAEAKINSWFKK